jgi:hypothetical protein
LRSVLWGPYDDRERATAIIASMMQTPPEVALPSLAAL